MKWSQKAKKPNLLWYFSLPQSWDSSSFLKNMILHYSSIYLFIYVYFQIYDFWYEVQKTEYHILHHCMKIVSHIKLELQSMSFINLIFQKINCFLVTFIILFMNIFINLYHRIVSKRVWLLFPSSKGSMNLTLYLLC